MPSTPQKPGHQSPSACDCPSKYPFPFPPPSATDSFGCFPSICPFRDQPLQNIAGGSTDFLDIQKCARPLGCHLERSNDSRGCRIMTRALGAGGSGESLAESFPFEIWDFWRCHLLYISPVRLLFILLECFSCLDS